MSWGVSMLPNKRLASYQSVAVATASPGKLILMLFDGAMRFLHAAEDGFKLSGVRERQEVVHNNLLKAQNIISELQRCLNLRDGGDFAINLFRLYDFMNTRLMEANVRKESENIRVVSRLLGEVRDAWDQMLREQAAANAQTATVSLSA
jgi:flagellar secretion chaperone FliS